MALVADASGSKACEEWYRLARSVLGYGHSEAVEYANVRFVEEQNRASHPERHRHAS
jgi:hypothetical protein